MPEGPSIIILKESVQSFIGEKIIQVFGNSKIDIHKIDGEIVTEFKSWGKHFLICFKTFTIRIHFLIFGTYRINEINPKSSSRLSLIFQTGALHFYACSVKFVEQPLDEVYDWRADVMNPSWDGRMAEKKLKEKGGMICDALLDQNIFAGVGNIIKNEVLFRIKVHPESEVSTLPAHKVKTLIREVVKYSFEFLQWKKDYELAKHWLAHNKKICPRDNIPFVRKYLGKTNRRSFYCTKCQKLYT